MNKKIVEYELSYKGYKLKVLNIGATITEYSLDGHNICLSFSDIEAYRNNELYAGCVVGRTAGRIKGGKVGDWELPKNYHEIHNHHGNGLHIAYYNVELTDNQIVCTLQDPEGDYPGNANIKVVYTLDNNGLTQEIIADSDKPTLFNFTNHSYFNLDLGKSVLDHNLQIDSSSYAHLDEEMFAVEDRDVRGTAFDFRQARTIGSTFDLDDCGQFGYTKFIDHPFKLDGGLTYSNEVYKLEIDTNCDYAVIYAANYLGGCQSELSVGEAIDYGAICFETQKIPGDINLVDTFYSKTNYKLSKY